MIKQTIFVSRELNDESPFNHSFDNNVFVKAFSLLEFEAIPIVEFPATDFIFFYSSKAVHFFFSQLDGVVLTAKLCCMGSGTAKALEALGYKPYFVGSGSVKEIANSFLQVCNNKSVLFPRAQNSRKSVQSEIQNQAEVKDLVVYSNKKKKSFEHPNANILVFTSPMNVEAYFESYKYQSEILIAIGETTQKKMEALGLKNIIVAKENSENALLDEVKKFVLTIE